MKYSVGDIIETKFFYIGSYDKNEYKRGTIIEIDNDNYYVDFNDGVNPRRLKINTFEKLSKKFDPGSGYSRKFNFM